MLLPKLLFSNYSSMYDLLFIDVYVLLFVKQDAFLDCWGREFLHEFELLGLWFSVVQMTIFHHVLLLEN